MEERGRKTIDWIGETVKNIFSITSDRLFSLQNTVAREDLRNFDMPKNVADLGIYDIEHTAAIMRCMDAVIVPDGGMAHLSAAIGANTWVYLRKFCEWRWVPGSEKSDWYPNTRLFRQRDEGDWSTVVDSICDHLAIMADVLG
jgi:hypothetical protein